MTVQVSLTQDGSKENDQQIMSLLQTAASMWMNNAKSKDGAPKKSVDGLVGSEPADGGKGVSTIAAKSYNKQYGTV